MSQELEEAEDRWGMAVNRASKHPAHDAIRIEYCSWRTLQRFISLIEDYTTCSAKLESIIAQHDEPVNLSDMAADEYDAIMQAQAIMEQLSG